jgi:hypothetical protein
MDKYKCHKVVEAEKISSISKGEIISDHSYITLEGGDRVKVSAEWMYSCYPKEGGYLVKHPDGRMSFSPADVFEAGYTLLDAEL